MPPPDEELDIEDGVEVLELPAVAYRLVLAYGGKEDDEVEVLQDENMPREVAVYMLNAALRVLLP